MKKTDSSYEKKYNESPFLCFLPTKNTTRKCESLNFFHFNFTFKCLFPELPVLVLGGSDLNRRFYIISLVICEKETSGAVLFCLNTL